MSNEQSVWPDGAREAVDRACRSWWDNPWNYQACATDLLTALEPFVQQRIAAEVTRLSTELREYQQVLRDHDNTATPGVLRGLLDQFKALRAEVARLKEQLEYYTGPRQESHPENVIHCLRVEVARLREDGERLDWLERSVPNGDLRRIVDSGKVPAVWPSTVRGFIDAARPPEGGTER